MQSVQWNALECEAPQQRQSEHTHRVASTPGKAAAGEKGQSDQQPVAADALHTAFTWLFGSGCF